MSHYDVLIIGAGPGGYVAAEEAAEQGLSVGVIEKKEIGGTCLNVGCIPSKAYIEHAHWLLSMEKAKHHGIGVEITEIDFEKLVDRKDNVVKTLRNGIHHTFHSHNIDYINGEAIYVEGKTFKVNEQEFSGDNIILATGGYPFIANIPGLDSGKFLTTDTIFDITSLPDKFVTIGGGIIAVELAFAFKPFGIDVTILEVAEDILPTVDNEAREIIKSSLQNLGIEIKTNVAIEQVTGNMVELSDGAHIDYDELLVATGRKQNLKLPQKIGMELDEAGQFVKVDEYYQTSRPGFFAIGDLAGGHTLAHAASAEGIKAVRAISGKKERPLSDAAIPRSLYTDPEVAEFGLSQKEAQALGYDVIVEKLPFSYNGRALAADESDGFVKIISEKNYRQILGAVIVGAHATDLIHQLLTLYEAEGTVDEVAQTVFGHPTLSELSQNVAKNILKNN